MMASYACDVIDSEEEEALAMLKTDQEVCAGIKAQIERVQRMKRNDAAWVQARARRHDAEIARLLDELALYGGAP